MLLRVRKANLSTGRLDVIETVLGKEVRGPSLGRVGRVLAMTVGAAATVQGRCQVLVVVNKVVKVHLVGGQVG